jgi:hypothetical protein
VRDTQLSLAELMRNLPDIAARIQEAGSPNPPRTVQESEERSRLISPVHVADVINGELDASASKAIKPATERRW